MSRLSLCKARQIVVFHWPQGFWPSVKGKRVYNGWWDDVVFTPVSLTKRLLRKACRALAMQFLTCDLSVIFFHLKYALPQKE